MGRTSEMRILSLALILLVVKPCWSSSTCPENAVDARVRNFIRDKAGAAVEYVVSFDVHDSCPSDSRIEGITIKYKYKTRLQNDSVIESSGITSGYIHPRDSHNTVITDKIVLAIGESEAIDVYLDSVRITY
jgi:hypothetical protein